MLDMVDFKSGLYPFRDEDRNRKLTIHQANVLLCQEMVGYGGFAAPVFLSNDSSWAIDKVLRSYFWTFRPTVDRMTKNSFNTIVDQLFLESQQIRFDEWLV